MNGMRNAECGMRNGPGERRAALQAYGDRRCPAIPHSEFRIPHWFFIPHSALRILLVCAAGACASSDGPRVTVNIPSGATLDAAVDSLAANHVIAHPGTFRLYARLRGLAGSLKSGVYLLRQDESWSDVVAALERRHHEIGRAHV